MTLGQTGVAPGPGVEPERTFVGRLTAAWGQPFPFSRNERVALQTCARRTHKHEETATPIRVAVMLVQVFKDQPACCGAGLAGVEEIESSFGASETPLRPSLTPSS